MQVFKMNIPYTVASKIFFVVDLCLQTFSEVVSHKRLVDGLFIEVALYFKFNSLHQKSFAFSQPTKKGPFLCLMPFMSCKKMKTPYREKTTIGSLGISQVKNPNLKVTKDYKNRGAYLNTQDLKWDCIFSKINQAIMRASF